MTTHNWMDIFECQRIHSIFSNPTNWRHVSIRLSANSFVMFLVNFWKTRTITKFTYFLCCFQLVWSRTPYFLEHLKEINATEQSSIFMTFYFMLITVFLKLFELFHELRYLVFFPSFLLSMHFNDGFLFDPFFHFNFFVFCLHYLSLLVNFQSFLLFAAIISV